MKRLFILVCCILMLCSCKNNTSKNELNVLNWSSYIPYEIINDFSKKTGIKVNYGTYSSNEELLAKLSSSKEGTYDLVFPSDYMVELMIKKNMLDRMDINRIDNFKNINPIFFKQKFDYNNEYSIPFLAATAVIAVNTNNIKDEISSYNDLLNPKYKNNIVVIDDQRMIIGSSLLALGYSMNDVDVTHIKQAKDFLLNLNPNIKAFDSDSPKTFLITNEVDIGIVWNAEAIIAKSINPKIEIIYPEDGFGISLDNYVLVKGSKNKDNAYKFINYLLNSEVNSKITDEYPYINTTISGRNLSEEELNNILNNGSYIENIGSKISLYDKVWAEIK